MSKIIYLTGMRASGKSTIGTMLAHKLNFKLVDTDSIIQHKLGYSLAQLVETQGWDAFRDMESTTLREIQIDAGKHSGGTVVSTGGGIILRSENRSSMLESGVIVYLEVQPEELTRRIEQAPDPENRPPLLGRSTSEELHEILRQRGAIYKGFAHHSIANNGKPEDALNEILELLQAEGF